MKLKQLSLFLENRPGQLRAPCDALGNAGIDLLTMTLADTAQFGILRFIVADPERAKKVLEAEGMIVSVTEVVPVQVDNRPGGLAAVLASIEAAGLGVEYMYDFAARTTPDKAAIIFRFEDPDRALAALKAAGVRILTSEELLGG
ncbi:MAG: amino acid-binding protein [Candidatus Limnocylindrales bacterium]|jgi:hypothetical protein